MTEKEPDFLYDVFLSHSAKDKAAARQIGERLKATGLRVWFHQWEVKSGDSIPEKIEEGLERSRVLVLFMSANAFDSDWTQLEAGTLRFRDPLNKERRFIPLRLDSAPIPRSLAQFLFIDWRPGNREKEYAKLLEACWSANQDGAKSSVVPRQPAEKAIELETKSAILAYAFDVSRDRALTSGDDKTIRLWDIRTGRCLRAFEGDAGRSENIAWTVDKRFALSGSSGNVVQLWDVEAGRCVRVFEGHTERVWGVVFSLDQRFALSGSFDKTLRLWEIKTGRCVRVFKGHADRVRTVIMRADQCLALSCADDNTIRLWDVSSGGCLGVLEGHTHWVLDVAWSPDQRFILSGSCDNTMRLWDVHNRRCLRVFEGHTLNVECIAWNASQTMALSGSPDKTVRLWDIETGNCLGVLEGPTSFVNSVVWSADQRYAIAGERYGGVSAWKLSPILTDSKRLGEPSKYLSSAPKQVEYTNAKVLLVGESGAGKTGLSMVLAHKKWKPSDSTVGAWATQWKLPVSSTEGVEREIWLWDFGGQADQRLIHQLYMEETALAVLVFDGQKEDVFETLGQWDRDLSRASSKEFSKLLVAGRVDAGSIRVSRSQIEAFARERGYSKFLETSAKSNLRCEDLRRAIVSGIRWEGIPWRSSPVLFKCLKDEIIHLKDTGRVLLRFNELREVLRLSLSGELARFADDELRAVIRLLAGPAVVWELKFGSWVLLQPERINAYAQAVIQTMRADEDERGCIEEERVLRGDLTYHSSIGRLEPDDERFVLLAMHQTLIERGLCLRQHTDKGVLLIFPSYYRRERKELIGAPAVLVSYRFNGFLDDIYATLVVRLHHTNSFERDELWRYAADFKTLTGKQLGVKLIRWAEGAGELEVYFDPTIDAGEKIIFSKYVHEHLLQTAKDVVRLRHYICPYCDTPVANREVAMRKLHEGKKDVLCVNCEKRVPLWDRMEELFASPAMKSRVHELKEQSSIVLDNESKDRALVGEVISTVALAGQISREFSTSDHGIDMEIEFKSGIGEATGRKLYLQLKSGDSYLRQRSRDAAEIFTIKKARHADYWMGQAFPVMLVIRNAEGEVRWMEIREALQRESAGGKKPVKRIVFVGERFDVMSVRRWRDRVLADSTPS